VKTTKGANGRKIQPPAATPGDQMDMVQDNHTNNPDEGDVDGADDEDEGDDEDDEDEDEVPAGEENPITRYEKMREEIQRERTVCFLDNFPYFILH
jgi:hypothetical protein